jgi:hypothetical protein
MPASNTGQVSLYLRKAVSQLIKARGNDLVLEELPLPRAKRRTTLQDGNMLLLPRAVYSE